MTSLKWFSLNGAGDVLSFTGNYNVSGDINFTGNLYQNGSLVGTGGGGGGSSQWTSIFGSGIYYNGPTVGIGKTNPSSSYKLDVGGDVNFDGDLYQNGVLFTGGGGSGLWSENGGELYTLTNVGLGTDNPANTLHVSNVSPVFDVSKGIRIGVGNDYATFNYITPVTGTEYLLIQSTKQGTANNRNISLNAIGGFVGVGRSDPGFALDVFGDVNFTGDIYKNGTLFTAGGSGSWLSSGLDVYYNTGNVGIGTFPSALYTLQVAGNMNFANAFDTINIGGSNVLSQDTLGSTVLNSSLTSVGNLTSLVVDTNTLIVDALTNRVGIGKTNPGYDLDVTGVINSSGGIYFNGSAIVSGGSLGPTITGSSLTSVGTLDSLTVSGNVQVATNAMVVDGLSRYVGIGTSNPTGARLHIDSLNDFRTLYLEASTASTGPHVEFKVDSSSVGRLAVINSSNPAPRQNAMELQVHDIPNGRINFCTAAGNVAFPSMTILSSGYVGIGTNDPAAVLHIFGTTTDLVSTPRSSPDGLLLIGSTTGENLAFDTNEIQARANSTTLGNLNLQAEGGDLRIHQNASGTEVYVLNNGNVGIGVTNPGFKLEVNGDVNFTGSLYQNGVLFSSGSSQWTTSGSDIYYTTGNVGIGTTNPGAGLDIFGSVRLTNSGANALPLSFFKTTTPVSGNELGYIDFRGSSPNGTNVRGSYLISHASENWTDTAAGANISFFTTPNGSLIERERMRITNTGNVGIGITAPDPGAKLEVAGGSIRITDINASGDQWGEGDTELNGLQFYMQDSGTVNTPKITHKIVQTVYDTTGNSRLDFFSSNANSTVMQTIPSITIKQGSIGIGTTNPGAKLDVGDTILVSKALSPSAGWSSLNTTDSKVLFYNAGGINWSGMGVDSGGHWWVRTGTSSQNVMLMRSDGTVGIGTTNPGSSKLYVNGPLSVNGPIHDTDYFTAGKTGSNSFVRVTNGGALAITDSGVSHSLVISHSSTMSRINSNAGFGLAVQENGGYVGFGTSAPLFPFHVTYAAGGSDPLGAHGFLNSTGAGTSTGGGAGFAIQAKFSGTVHADLYRALSDGRIKTNIRLLNDGDALSKLRIIEPRTYGYIDTLKYGSSDVIGFIAQEVKDVLPEAIAIDKDFIPDVYRMADYDIINHIVTLPGLAKDGRMKFATRKSYKDFEVQAIDNDHLRVIVSSEPIDQETIGDSTPKLSLDHITTEDLTEEGQIFVYGYFVEDLHTIKKDNLWAINFAATQEIDRTVESQKQKIVFLETQVANQTSVIQDVQNENESLTSKLAALEGQFNNLLSKLASQGIVIN